MPLISSIFVGVVGLLQGFFLKPAIFSVRLFLRRAGIKLSGEAQPHYPFPSSLFDIFCLIVGDVLAVLLIFLLPVIIIVVIFRIQNYYPLAWIIGMFAGLAAYRAKEIRKGRK
jgi:hypothetical protein